MTTKCPRCGRLVELVTIPGNPGRVQGFCQCNPFGPVIETDAPDAGQPQGADSTVEEVKKT